MWKGQCCQTHGGGTAGALLTWTTHILLPSPVCPAPAGLHPHLIPRQACAAFVSACRLTNVRTHACLVLVCSCRKRGMTCPNGGSSITLVRQDSERQGGAKEEGTTGRKGSDVNESSNLSCHVRSEAELSLSSTRLCVCVCVCGGGWQRCHVWYCGPTLAVQSDGLFAGSTVWSPYISVRDVCLCAGRRVCVSWLKEHLNVCVCSKHVRYALWLHAAEGKADCHNIYVQCRCVCEREYIMIGKRRWCKNVSTLLLCCDSE